MSVTKFRALIVAGLGLLSIAASCRAPALYTETLYQVAGSDGTGWKS